MIKKILIANRGEIALRIIRSSREMQIQTVSVYSDIDRHAMHVRLADEAYHIGPSPSADSYLNMDRILEVALQAGADAIHPGYGFLSENAEFAEKVKAAGLIFIGPNPTAIRTMGDKITARKTMIAAGVPVVPGTEHVIKNEADAERIVREIGLPIMLKASAGGGGKGMRLVHTKEELMPSLRAAKSEAGAAFGNDAVYIERYIEFPHHIEFQILGDQYGNYVHLGERECSVQRRHQKVIEETPSVLMTPGLRKEMGEQAIAAARSVHYEGAGTVEFLVDDKGNHYFLEMNTRLQVEHPVTEQVIGVDLVKEQIRVARGEKLNITQDQVVQRGHAVECRIYAEDPDNNFMPSPGKILKMREPNGPGVRVDGYVYEGFEIPIYYDPMISKLITFGASRDESIQRMIRALDEYQITGVKTSIPFLKKILKNKDFREGNYNTHFISTHQEELFAEEPSSKEQEMEELAAVTALLEYLEERKSKIFPSNGSGKRHSMWKEIGRKKALTRL
ncbi:MAG: acetyl-CoA carboxylase biotin carboxylase subunit [Nitrospiraceae bacterium]|nr:acetyl-CoA carboxylase biotin carboxylase subunit [Nitrospiraceae bacterium]